MAGRGAARPVVLRVVLRPLHRRLRLREAAVVAGRPRTGRTRRAGCRRSSRGRCGRRSCRVSGPPQIWRSAALSMIQFIARRTWMSSNGGWVRFIVRYSTRSPELRWRYCRFDGSRRVPLERLRRQARRVLVLELAGRDPVDDVGHVRVDRELGTRPGGSAGRPGSRSSGRSRGCGRGSRFETARRSRSSASASRTTSASTLSAPSIMYGPVETTSLPYLPAWPSKHFATSAGIGPVAGIASR